MLAWSIFPSLDAISKFLADGYNVYFVLWARFAAQLLVGVLIVLPRGLIGTARTPFLSQQLLRSGGFTAHTVIFILGILTLPLAEGSALLFTGPIMLAALSVPLLNERVDRATWIAVLAGFAGAMVVIRPGLDFANWGALLVLLSTLCFVLYQIATRSLAQRENPYTTLLYTPAVGAVALGLCLPWTWSAPSMHDAALMGLMGLVGAVGHLMLIKAYENAGAAQLAPYSYVHILSAALLGYAVFGDVPDLWAAAGAAIIAVSGLWLAWRKGVTGRVA
ncbi:MAG: DMT family transporter [Alphaproteobacteria bacterium]